ncbi:MAG: hypothetical protein Q7T33_14155 [Dehalococcoidia bacterium]|nr:hypothetical protein [Dehalococcoidia bacterium]
MTNVIYRLPGVIPDPDRDPAGYYGAVSQLMAEGRIAWGPVLVPVSGAAHTPFAQRARGLTAQQAAPQYRYRAVGIDRVPHSVRASATLGFKTASRDLKLTRYAQLLFFTAASPGENERFSTRVQALGYTEQTGMWADVFVHVEQSNISACMSAVHEVFHVARDGHWRGRADRSPRESAQEEAEANRYMYDLMGRCGLWAVRGLR